MLRRKMLGFIHFKRCLFREVMLSYLSQESENELDAFYSI